MKMNRRAVLIALQRFLSFFLLMCLVTTCVMVGFIQILSKTLSIELGKEEIQNAARFTFFNVIVISLICTLIDALRHRIMVERPARRIADAAQKVMQGDFSVRIDKVRSLDPVDDFNAIIDYFNRMIEELSGMETLRTDFVANVSHELKTPLAVMQNYGTMLQQSDLSEKERMEYAKIITDAARNLAGMVTNILKLNKLENQTIYPDVCEYDLSEQLTECLLGFEEIWEKKDIDLDVDLPEGVKICADPELLSLAWNNLLSNAFKFTEPGGRVGLKLAVDEKELIVRVSDTGCGISREVGEHMFEKFYQGDTSHASRGNGLGLALVKRVIDITGGVISVSSQVGVGSTFTVTMERNAG